jgi:hypothetical protein
MPWTKLFPVMHRPESSENWLAVFTTTRAKTRNSACFRPPYDLSQFGFRHVPFIRVQRHVENLRIVANPIPSAKYAAAFGFENVTQHIMALQVATFFADRSSESIAIPESLRTPIVRRQSYGGQFCLTFAGTWRLP